MRINSLAVAHLRHVLRDNTVAGSRKNIEEHYDLGNAMYKLFLDESMTYSCGVHTAACGARGLAESLIRSLGVRVCGV
jgi:cyclopropane fatty-acyl-phospholipid synthase-like methyltransferase